MTPPPALPRDAAPGLAAILGSLLCALLAALLGVARVRPRAGDDAGVMAMVARCAAEAEEPLFEEWVEWIAVPAPWRATQGLWRYCARAWGGWSPRPGLWRGKRGRGPPARHFALCTASTGMA